MLLDGHGAGQTAELDGLRPGPLDLEVDFGVVAGGAVGQEHGDRGQPVCGRRELLRLVFTEAERNALGQLFVDVDRYKPEIEQYTRRGLRCDIAA